jgi:two-component system cell cycle sensor histidine kinase/response regulator CckA
VIELDEALSDISVLLGRLLGETIKLELKRGRDVWPIKADLNQLEQVIVNLAVNARDAMPDGGTLSIRTSNVTEKESLKFREQGFKPGDYVLVEVSDTGTGMPPEVKEKIFEPFFTTKSRGSGLGLPTTKRLVEAHDGRVTIDCPPAGGTTVVVHLPLDAT